MTELPPAAQAVLGALSADPATPVKVLITGGIGTGKSTVLATIRDTLRAAGRTVRTHPAPADGTPAATLVDDLQLLTGPQLGTLAELAMDPAATVIVATEPREQHPELRAVMSTIERERPRITLAPWPRPEVARRLATTDPEEMSDVMAVTAGLPFLVTPVAATGWSHDGLNRVVQTALTERLRRLDGDMLSTLVILSLTPGLGATDVAAALEMPVDEAADLVDRCHATGLLDPAHGMRFAAVVHRCAALICGSVRHHAIESALLHTQTERDSLSTELALTLAEHGLRDAHLVEVLQDRAGHTGRPAKTARLLRAAVRAGAGGPDLELRLADALALSGDCAGAAAVTDTLLGMDGAHRSAAVRIAASVATHDGNTGHAADLFDWLTADGTAPGPETRAAGVIVLVGAGEPGAARELAARPSAGPPTSTARAVRSLADGILMTLDQPYPQAAARLGQALGPTAAPEAAMPDSAAALTTLAALHAGDAIRARAVIGRAVELTADDGAFGPRHRLLRAWVRMQDGQLVAAANDLDAVASASAAALHRRESLWASTLRAALARRTGDTGALLQHWFGAMEDLAEYSVDLYSLLPLGELWICAERLHQDDRIRYAVDQGFAVLRSLGDPPAWSLPLHWAGVHAAILAGSPGSMAPHGQALAGAAADSGFAATLAAAGRAWLRVLARQVDPADVGAAARGLASCGLTWDATRLAGQAALQADDARVSAEMLQIARDLKLATDLPEEPGHAAAGVTKAAPPGQAPLSEREREVAELLLMGMPYRDIGAQLFISAKTVEHHVARIRRRLGAESRSEMLSMLRAILAPGSAAPAREP